MIEKKEVKFQLSPIDENGYPKPRKAECFKCKEWFWLKFVVPQRNYSLKNNWGYWTKKEENENKFVCNSCLRNIYLNEKELYLEAIKDIKKKRMLSSYISSNSI